MNKRYFKWQFKNWISLSVVTCLVMLLVFLITIMNINVVPSVSMNKDNIYLPYNTPYIGLTIAAGLMSLVIPIFVCKYRFKRRSADIFGEAPFDKGELLRTRALIGLIILLGAYTLVFIIGTIVIVFKQVYYNSIADSAYKLGLIDSPYYYNYGIVILYWLFYLICLGLAYYLNVYIASLGTNSFNSVVYLLIATVVLSLNVSLISRFLSSISSSIDSIYPYAPIGWLYGIVVGFMCFDKSIVNNSFMLTYGVDMPNTIMIVVTTVVFIGLSIASIVFVNKGYKEYPEDFGKANPTKLLPQLFIHIMFFFLAWSTASPSLLNMLFISVISSISSFIMYGLSYYLCTAVLTKKFNLSKLDWISYSINVGICLVLVLIKIGFNYNS